MAKEDAGKEDIETASKDLSDTLSQIGQAMYAGGAGQGQSATGPEPAEGVSKEKTEEPKDGEEGKGKKNEKVEEGEVVE